MRNLAGRAADAAKEIRSLITESATRVDTGTQPANQARTTMGEMVSSIRRVADIMGEISATSSEQSAGVNICAAPVCVILSACTRQGGNPRSLAWQSRQADLHPSCRMDCPPQRQE